MTAFDKGDDVRPPVAFAATTKEYEPGPAMTPSDTKNNPAASPDIVVVTANWGEDIALWCRAFGCGWTHVFETDEVRVADLAAALHSHIKGSHDDAGKP